MNAFPEKPDAADRPPIGVIAGGGTLPGLVAQGIRAAGRSVAGIGLRGNVEPEFAALCDRFATVGVVRLGQWVRVARRFGVREAIMVGRVSKLRLHNPVGVLLELPDVRTCRFGTVECAAPIAAPRCCSRRWRTNFSKAACG